MFTPWYKQKFHKRFRKGSRNGHGIHSPFMFDLITNTVENQHSFYAFNQIEKSQNTLFQSNEIIHIRNWGEYFGLQKNIYTTSEISMRTELDKPSGELLFRLINKFKCRNIIHYGPTLRSNLLYLNSVDKRINTDLIEQKNECISKAKELLESCQIKNSLKSYLEFPSNGQAYDFALINFPQSALKTSSTISAVLPHLKEGGVLAIRGINSNKEMSNYWTKFKTQQKQGVTLDLNIIGLLFFSPELQNQHFIY